MDQVKEETKRPESRAGINQITFHTPTLHNVSINPGPVNFFFGKNGTGKSTIAKALTDPAMASINGNALEKEPAAIPKLCIYNEDYINGHIYGNRDFPGIYTFSRKNVHNQKALEGWKQKKEELEEIIRTKTEEEKERERLDAEKKERFCQEVWRATAFYRKRYSEAFRAEVNLEKFTHDLLEEQTEKIPVEELDSLYEVAFQSEAQTWTPYDLIPDDLVPSCDLMDIPIVSGSDSVIGVFYKTLSNFDWVRKGHDVYMGAAGSCCPYCGQRLPERFEEQFTACLDEKYKKQISELKEFAENYQSAMECLESVLEQNHSNGFKSKETAEYKEQAKILLSRIRTNQMIIQQKLDNPKDELILENTKKLIDRLNQMASVINDRILHYNQAAENIPRERERCIRQIRRAMAADCQELLMAIKRESASDTGKIKKLEIRKLEFDLTEAQKAIDGLNASFEDTSEMMEAINSALDACGFTSFFFQKAKGKEGAYELVRDGDTNPAGHLSEGERRFVAFLYFYYSVLSGCVEQGKQNEMIVVIDDPVCSMDSEGFMTVNALIQDMIRICLKNYRAEDQSEGGHIVQMFILTHNRYFFQAVSDMHLTDCRNCFFFEVTKGRDNVSQIRRCLGAEDGIGKREKNGSPVQNAYQSLWKHYVQSEDSQDILMYARQILYHYFMQTCHYDVHEFRKTLLEEHGETMIGKQDERMDVRQRNTGIVCSLLSFVNKNAQGIMDAFSFDMKAVPGEQIRNVVRKIFEIMHQEQHYQHMTETA